MSNLSPDTQAQHKNYSYINVWFWGWEKAQQLRAFAVPLEDRVQFLEPKMWLKGTSKSSSGESILSSRLMDNHSSNMFTFHMYIKLKHPNNNKKNQITYKRMHIIYVCIYPKRTSHSTLCTDMEHHIF